MIHTKETPKPPGDETAADVRCGTCAAVLAGPFCQAGGQPASDPLRSVRTFAAQVSADLFRLDSRAVRTLRALLRRPGTLTRTYLAGARVRYTGPLHVYLLAAAVFFLVNAYRPVAAFDARTRGVSVATFEARFEAIVQGNLPTVMAGSILLFALALRAFHRKRGYMAHVLFSLHWCAIYLLLMIADRLMPPIGIVHDAAAVGVLLLASRTWCALRVVYGESWA